jgi:uncharacterized SAM-dependent methyltransferase
VAKYQSPCREYDREVTASQRTLVLRRYFSDNQAMSSLVNVAIHPSQFPEKVRADLVESLRARAVNHKFHYDSVKQTQKWLALHGAHSPSRNDADGASVYDSGFEAAAMRVDSKQVHLVGLGCGGGRKDTRLLRLLRGQGREIFYTPCDVSTAMVLTARESSLAVVAGEHCFPVVCDLMAAGDLPGIFHRRDTERAARLTTFFGMIPNFEPEMILPKLASLIGGEDLLLFSANLAPGGDYAAGVERIMPQYDNALTRDWLLAFLFDLGVEFRDGELRFGIEDVNGLKRVAARFHFAQSREIMIGDERFEFQAGESIRLFFSYRYTPELARERLGRHGLAVMDEWVTRSGEEGVFLCRRDGGRILPRG